MFSSVSAFGWNDGADSAPEHYSRSQYVRDWLVYTALAGNNMPLTAHLRASQSGAFERVCNGVRRGTITLDYAPANDAIVEMPPINHPHHMQAMLYWCVRIDCSMSVLSEAYAQLGRSASLDQIRQVSKRVRQEEERERARKQSDKGWMRTQGHSNGAAATMPMFRP
ncbi:MAG: hypothetical protein EOO28_27040 [Comamonadaceae bacterium]|nr:MAG: hypothetical protein EOO28_27040 [Comamonadaceae bacterium]